MPQATIYIAGLFTIIYGYREKHRTRFNECHHFRICPLRLIMYLVKSAIFIIAVLAFVISIACFAFALTVYVTLFAADKTCEFGQEATVVILDSLSTQDVWEVDDEFEIDDDTLDEICKQVNKSLNSGKVATIGGIVLLCGQVIVLCYFSSTRHYHWLRRTSSTSRLTRTHSSADDTHVLVKLKTGAYLLSYYKVSWVLGEGCVHPDFYTREY